VSSSTPDSVTVKPSNVSVSRLNENAAAETSVPTTAVVNPKVVEAKAPADVLPQNSSVIAPALSHSAKVQ